MRCKSVSGAAKLFAHCRASRATSNTTYTASSRSRHTRTADDRGFRCAHTYVPNPLTRGGSSYNWTSSALIQYGRRKSCGVRRMHQMLHASITRPIQPRSMGLQIGLLIARRPDADGAALVGHRHQAGRCTKRWCASLQDCCQPPSTERQQPPPTHIPQKRITFATKRTSTHLVFQIHPIATFPAPSLALANLSALEAFGMVIQELTHYSR